MAAAMSVGIVTTLVVGEPKRNTSKSYLETTGEYARFLLLFAVAGFIGVYVLSSNVVAAARTVLASLFDNSILAATLVEACRLAGAL